MDDISSQGIQMMGILRNRFLYNMYHSKNTIVFILDANSCIGAKLAFYGPLVLIFLSRSYVMLLSKFQKQELL